MTERSRSRSERWPRLEVVQETEEMKALCFHESEIPPPAEPPSVCRTCASHSPAFAGGASLSYQGKSTSKLYSEECVYLSLKNQIINFIKEEMLVYFTNFGTFKTKKKQQTVFQNIDRLENNYIENVSEMVREDIATLFLTKLLIRTHKSLKLFNIDKIQPLRGCLDKDCSFLAFIDDETLRSQSNLKEDTQECSFYELFSEKEKIFKIINQNCQISELTFSENLELFINGISDSIMTLNEVVEVKLPRAYETLPLILFSRVERQQPLEVPSVKYQLLCHIVYFLTMALWPDNYYLYMQYKRKY